MTKQVSDSISGAGVYRGSQPSDDALIHTGPEQRVRHQSGSTVGDGWTRHTKRTWQNRLNPRSPIRNTARSQFEGLVASHCQVPQQERALPDAVRNKPTLAFPVLQTRRYPELGVTVQTLAERLDIPWDVKFSNAGDAFFTERGGALSVFRAGAEGPEVLWRHSVGSGEGGMLGLALDPEFGEANQWIYVYLTDSEAGDNRVIRIDLANNNDERVILSGIPREGIHNGGRINFGPDGMLYVTTGDAGRRRNSQRLDVLAGKILRIAKDGSVPSDNPFVGDPNVRGEIFSYGHRNPQSLSWNTRGDLFASEFGQRSHDELNLIRPGANYGWPNAQGDEHEPDFEPPLAHSGSSPSWAPSGGTLVASPAFPEWQGHYLMAMLGFRPGAARGIRVFEIDDGNQVRSQQVVFQEDFGRIRHIEQGPDGMLYVLTSNRDGRGDPVDTDDRLLRIVPLQPRESVAFGQVQSTLNSIMARWAEVQGVEPGLDVHGDGFGWETREQLLNASAFGRFRLVEPEFIGNGRGKDTTLVRSLRDSNPGPFPRMPIGGPYATPEEIQLIIDWIDAGAR